MVNIGVMSERAGMRKVQLLGRNIVLAGDGDLFAVFLDVTDGHREHAVAALTEEDGESIVSEIRSFVINRRTSAGEGSLAVFAIAARPLRKLSKAK